MNKRLGILCALVLCTSLVSAKKTSVPSLSFFTLENGLELFVLENNAAPLAYIEIAVRAGGVTQTPENAGLFHLYEHMMFKGNERYPDQKSAIEGMNRMGVSNWNGSTGIDMVNYFFQVPVSELKNGLEFWSYAIRTPLMNETEFENEKGVVISEIAADKSSPAHIRMASLWSALFPSSPWKLDSGGTPQTVGNATIEQLRSIQSTYYVPNNAALFVGGAVKADEVYRLVKEIYGDWKRGEKVPPVNLPSKNLQVKKLVYPSPSSNGGYISAQYYLRGPDGQEGGADMYAALVWATMVDNPSCEYARFFISDKELSIPDFDYIRGFAGINRASSTLGFSCVMLTSGSLSPVQKAERYLETLTEKSIPSFLQSSFLNEKEILSAKLQMEKDSLYAMDSVSGYLSSLASQWAHFSTSDLLFSDKKIKKVSVKDVESFVKNYLLDKNGVFILTVSPQIYEQYKKDFEKAGYQLVTAQNAFWWSNSDSKNLSINTRDFPN